MIITKPINSKNQEFVVTSADTISKQEFLEGKEFPCLPLYLTTFVAQKLDDRIRFYILEDDQGNLHQISFFVYERLEIEKLNLPEIVFP